MKSTTRPSGTCWHPPQSPQESVCLRAKSEHCCRLGSCHAVIHVKSYCSSMLSMLQVWWTECEEALRLHAVLPRTCLHHVLPHLPGVQHSRCKLSVSMLHSSCAVVWHVLHAVHDRWPCYWDVGILVDNTYHDKACSYEGFQVQLAMRLLSMLQGEGDPQECDHPQVRNCTGRRRCADAGIMQKRLDAVSGSYALYHAKQARHLSLMNAGLHELQHQLARQTMETCTHPRSSWCTYCLLTGAHATGQQNLNTPAPSTIVIGDSKACIRRTGLPLLLPAAKPVVHMQLAPYLAPHWRL